jgi:hypothetical protein
MKEIELFEQPIAIALPVAILGVHCSRWTATNTIEFSQAKAQLFEKMRDKRFDILPCQNKTGKYSRYVSFKAWGDFNQENLQLLSINESTDCIYYLTEVKDVVKLMVKNQRNFYFLDNHSEVNGLFTFSEFNTKEFYYWLYKQLVEVEKHLGSILTALISEEELFNQIERTSKINSDKGEYFKEPLSRFKADEQAGADASVIEYLYLKQLIDLIADLNLFKNLGYKKKDEFIQNSGNLNEIRSSIAHPVKSLVTDPESLKTLNAAIEKMEEYMSIKMPLNK